MVWSDAGELLDVPSRLDYFVNRLLCLMLSQETNNSGQEVLRIRYPSLKPSAKAALEYRHMARISSPLDPLMLDPTFNRQQTADHLAQLFPEVFSTAERHSGDIAGVSSSWYIQLVKERTTLTNIEGQSGATVAQLLDHATHEGRRALSREIFLSEFL
jgi:hypothetical protein